MSADIAAIVRGDVRRAIEAASDREDAVARVLEALDAAPRPVIGLTAWGSECVRCGNTTAGSMECDCCHESRWTVPLYVSGHAVRDLERALEAQGVAR